MDTTTDVFREFKAYWELSEQMIGDATKDDLAETARVLAIQVAHYARKFGELPVPDLNRLLTMMNLDDDGVALLRDGSQALVGVLAILTADGEAVGTEPMQ